MQKQRFEYRHGIIGCECAIIAPIVVSLLFALFGMIYCTISGISTEILDTSAVFKTLATVGTEVSFLIAALLIAHRGKINYFEGAGIKVRTPWWTYVAACVLSVIILLLLNPIINCWQYFLLEMGHKTGSLPFEMTNAGTLILGLGLFALLPAICEEALFRGVILNSLRKYGAIASIGLSSTFFSIMHMNLLQIPYTFLLGIALGIVVYFTRNLWLSTIIHFTNNASVLLINYFSTAETSAFVWTDILWGLLGLVVFVVLIYLLVLFSKRVFGDKTSAIEQPFCEQQPQIDHKTRVKMWIAPIFIGIACLVISILGGFGVL